MSGALPPFAEIVLREPDTFCPSAAMLTSLEGAPNAAAVEIPPLYYHGPFEDAMLEGHGQFVFSSDNEVFFYGDNVKRNGSVHPTCPWLF